MQREVEGESDQRLGKHTRCRLHKTLDLLHARWAFVGHRTLGAAWSCTNTARCLLVLETHPSFPLLCAGGCEHQPCRWHRACTLHEHSGAGVS